MAQARALGPSRVWFTLGFGIVNEVYYPRLNIPQIRDLGFIVADGCGFWVEVKWLQNYTLRLPAPGTPAVVVPKQALGNDSILGRDVSPSSVN
jgi:glucoamylase